MVSSAEPTGAWTGENAFRLLPEDPPHAASATAAVQVSGTMTTVGYTWEHPADGPQVGLLTLGPGPADEAATGAPVVALWGDSWHQAPEARVLTGRVVDDGSGRREVTVGYEYAEREWRWEVVLTTAPDTLELRMDNVPLTDGERYAAMTATFARP
ncbi:hypothetical protein [Kineococcus sp. NPDC059986]|uniref:hypothetical protein n=1 Tax=Kineococcus sp. NPDC059986 TaxID=3155538 RepID=UPI00344B7432